MQDQYHQHDKSDERFDRALKTACSLARPGLIGVGRGCGCGVRQPRLELSRRRLRRGGRFVRLELHLSCDQIELEGMAWSTGSQTGWIVAVRSEKAS